MFTKSSLDKTLELWLESDIDFCPNGSAIGQQFFGCFIIFFFVAAQTFDFKRSKIYWPLLRRGWKSIIYADCIFSCTNKLYKTPLYALTMI